MVLTYNRMRVIHSRWIAQLPENERHCVGYSQSRLSGRAKSQCLIAGGGMAQKGKPMKKVVPVSGMPASVSSETCRMPGYLSSWDPQALPL